MRFDGGRGIGGVMLLIVAAACGGGDAPADGGGEELVVGDSVVTSGPTTFGGDTTLGAAGSAGAVGAGVDGAAAPSGGGGVSGTGGTGAGTGAGATAGAEVREPERPPTPVSPDDPSASEILARAAAAYAGVETMRADFTQRAENPVLRRTTISRGTLFQRRPDRFLMRFSEPAGDLIVSDGEYIWVYYPSVNEDQVIRVPAGSAGAGAVDLQAQFLGDPTRRFESELLGREQVGGANAWVLVLRPRGGQGYRSLKVWIDPRDYLARRFEITESNGVVRRFDLSALRTGVNLDDALFEFEPPEGTHVVARG